MEVLRRIEGGWDNLHILICRAMSSDGSRHVDFVQKTTRNLAEFKVALSIAHERIAPCIMRVYGATLMFDRFAICAEYVEDAVPFALSKDTVAPLASALRQLAQRGRRVENRPALRRRQAWFRTLGREFFDHVGRRDEVGRALDRIEALPFVLSHNDLVPSNLICRRSAPHDPVFVDIGSVCLNRAGADLEAFAAAGDAEGALAEQGEFFTLLSADYAARMGLDARDVRLSARFFAASKALNRAINRASGSPFAEAAEHVQAALEDLRS
ncbi:hypothetical protein [Vannielia litorea]|uniref:Aminoglycoside phosphotransferase domain-containing protein n=1 Tax=Vannielia litorea TaxID=1217970 RepID=A0A1N6FBU5_9RHOB|nr:hypothetical protein [Vannielia litorea]SIN92765.1 hypothetical protein SAMN05444002_1549 [Vannielia litorea]